MNSFESYPLTTLARCLVIPIDEVWCGYTNYHPTKFDGTAVNLYAAVPGPQLVAAATPWLQNLDQPSYQGQTYVDSKRSYTTSIPELYFYCRSVAEIQ